MNVKNPPYGKKNMKKKKREELERKIQSYQSALKEKARLGMWISKALKRRATVPEKTLLDALTRLNYWLKFQPYFFTDKHLFIPDFRLATTQYKLIIEVDGPSHNQQREYDAARTAWLQKNRNCVIERFSNEDVMMRIEMVLEKIAQHKPLTIHELTPSKSRLRQMQASAGLAEDCDPAEQFKRYS